MWDLWKVNASNRVPLRVSYSGLTGTDAKSPNSVVCLFGVFLDVPHSSWDISSPGQGSNPCPLQWKCRVLTTGLPERSRACVRAKSL